MSHRGWHGEDDFRLVRWDGVVHGLERGEHLDVLEVQRRAGNGWPTTNTPLCTTAGLQFRGELLVLIRFDGFAGLGSPLARHPLHVGAGPFHHFFARTADEAEREASMGICISPVLVEQDHELEKTSRGIDRKEDRVARLDGGMHQINNSCITVLSAGVDDEPALNLGDEQIRPSYRIRTTRRARRARWTSR